MASLVRLRAAGFDVEDAVTLDQVRQFVSEGSLGDHIIPTDAFFKEYGAVRVREEEDRLLINGNPFLREDLVLYQEDPGIEPVMTKKLRMYTSDGRFAGVYERYGRRYKPWKMFISQQD